MNWLSPTAFLYLGYFDLYLVRHDFHSLYQHVRSFPVTESSCRGGIEQICAAVDQAIVWYPKQVLCLQRSTAAVWLLKRSGFPAQLILGAQLLPFKAHAWVEIEGRVINDKPSVSQSYSVLERC
jgi:hypothetical protein